MQVEQDLVAIGLGQAIGRDDAHRHSGNLVFDKLVGAKAVPGYAGACRVSSVPLRRSASDCGGA